MKGVLKIKSNIVLVGFMGCGKSSVGRELAKLLELKYLDTDMAIEEKSGMKISDIFAQHGEKYFRDLESSMCVELSKENNLLVSTGGGIVLRKENIENLKKSGVIFLLRATAETTFERISHKKDRPLLQVPNPMEKIKELLEAREEFYKGAADFEIITDNRSVADIAQEIKEKYLND